MKDPIQQIRFHVFAGDPADLPIRCGKVKKKTGTTAAQTSTENVTASLTPEALRTRASLRECITKSGKMQAAVCKKSENQAAREGGQILDTRTSGGGKETAAIWKRNGMMVGEVATSSGVNVKDIGTGAKPPFIGPTGNNIISPAEKSSGNAKNQAAREDGQILDTRNDSRSPSDQTGTNDLTGKYNRRGGKVKRKTGNSISTETKPPGIVPSARKRGAYRPASFIM